MDSRTSSGTISGEKVSPLAPVESANTVVCFGVRDSTSFADGIEAETRVTGSRSKFSDEELTSSDAVSVS